MTFALLVLQQIIAASTHLIAKSVTHDFHPATVVLWRGIFTCLAFAAWMFVRRSKTRKIERVDYSKFLILGLINIPLNQILFVWGVKFTTAPNAALAYALTPAFVLLIGFIFYKEKFEKFKTIGVTVAMFGAFVVLIDKGASFAPTHTLGNIMVLMASASWAAYTVFGKPLVIKYGAVFTTAISFFLGLLFFIPVYFVLPLFTEIGSVVAEGAPFDWWLKVLYLGVITSGVGYGLWYYALSRLESAKVAVFNNLQPILTTIMALIIFGTHPTPLFLIGGSIALTGVIITQAKGLFK
ncbi:MAG: EamA family transporter [Ignavibacteria bacterium]|nr:EamA family transporter [Ignavibacteria bacterium]